LSAQLEKEAPRGGPIVRWLGRVDYEPTWRAMQTFTEQRNASTADELWLLEHPPVFTLGMNADPKHVLAAGDIPVIRIDRGGQVTYHGPGQLIAYVLVDLKRARLGVRNLVTALEQAVVDYGATLGIAAAAKCGAPGVYVEGKKLASLGIRVRRGASYHGLALNVDMDLEPFSRINPCGFSDLQMTQLSELGRAVTLREAGDGLAAKLGARLAGYSGYDIVEGQSSGG
jgi:lipoyl(octanoyl) transferase